jgi:predicted permease
MPDWAARVRDRLSGLHLDPATEAETIEEFAEHVDERYRDLIARGLDPVVAETQAWRELEGDERLVREISAARVTLLPAPTQDASRGGLGALTDDLRFAWRRLRHAPGFAIVALLTVMLTVGANTAILSIADAVLFRPLPYADPGQIAIIQMLDRKTGNRYTMTPYVFLNAINDACPSVSEVGLLESGPNLRAETADGPTNVSAMVATPNYFQILGIVPARGRAFNEHDVGSEGRAALLTYAAWQQRFGADESIVGRSVTIGTSSFDVIGVLPQGFILPSQFADRVSLVVLRKPWLRGEKGGSFHAIVRLAGDVSFAQAQAEVDAAIASAPAGPPGVATTRPVLDDVRRVLYPVGRPIMRYLLAAAGLILILGFANLANMMLVRGRRSMRETAVRLALGANRIRLVRPMLFEAAIIGLAGATLAVMLTSLAFDAMLKQVPAAAYGRAPVGVGARVIAISLTMGLVGALVFGVLPAWRMAGIDVLALIRRSRTTCVPARLGRPMIIAQVAVAVAVAFGAGIATRAFVAVLRTPLGFSADNVVQISIGPPQAVTDRLGFYRQVSDALTTSRGVIAFGGTGTLPFSRSAPSAGARIPGSTKDVAGVVHTLPGYFEAAAIPIIRGRALTWDDTRNDPNVAVVSLSASRALFPDRESIGAVFENSSGNTFRVIGIAGDVRRAVAEEPTAWAYVLPDARANGMYVIARLRERSDAALGELKAALTPLASRAPVLTWWADSIHDDNAYRDPRFQTLVLGTLATLAIGLTALGIFSVVAYLVAARTREMGVRLAIGSSPSELVWLVIRQTLAPVGLGLVAGLLLIKWGSQLAEAQFFKVDAHDPLIVAVAVTTVILASLLAAYLPARRATRINPTDVLRAE